MNRDAPGSGLASLMAMQGRMGDTELVHMNPMEVKMFDAMTPGGMTRNPATGAPEGFAWWLPIIGAAIGGIAGGVKGGGFKNVLKGAALGGLAGLGGAGFMSATGLGGAGAGALGSAWGPFSGLQGLFGGTGAASVGAGTGGGVYAPWLGGAGATAASPLGLTSGAAAGSQALSSVPHTMGMFGGVPPQAAISGTAITNPLTQTLMTSTPTGTGIGFASPTTSPIAPTFSTPEALRATTAQQLANPPTQPKWLQRLGQTLTGRGTGTEPVEETVSPLSLNAPFEPPVEETWLQRNRLPVSAGVVGASLLANQQPDFTGTSSPFEAVAKGAGTARVRGRGPFDVRDITAEQALEEATGPGGIEEFITEEDVEDIEERTGGLISLYGGGTPDILGGKRSGNRISLLGGSQGYFGPTHPGSQPPPPGMTYVPGQTPMHGPVLRKVSDVGGVYIGGTGQGQGGINLVKGATMGPSGQISFPDWERAGDTGAATAAPEEVEEVSDIEVRERAPRAFRNPAGGTGELTEQQIVDYMTGVTPGGLPNLLNAPFGGTGSTEEEIASQFIGSARGGNVFEGQVHTTGDGMSDDRRFDIVETNPTGFGPHVKTNTDAVIARDEYVWPADAVAMLGNGSSNAGADILDNAVKNIRYASIGHKNQVNQIDGKKQLRKALTA